jgi:hypothetical protein
MCATAALNPNASNWGGKGGCLGFFIHLFFLAVTQIRLLVQMKSVKLAHWYKYMEFAAGATLILQI